ncbi:hypothetical protein G7084_02425 [Weissella coleopterorum]|uniref:DUF4115 domain-containing protein n=1 Tax=Weissella coleopterorum TaxID=2714949 RepID=A0A6G8AZ85_9LACO|nr:hypothetical protein [Weissella coleopterorum]QIL50279.1 hypothetical protein G7084_02425 [Weissella coleopterorum]
MTDEQFQQLKRYKELLDVGVLAPSEYEKLKDRFLQVEMIALDLEQAQKPQPITESRNKTQARQKKGLPWLKWLLYLLLLLLLLLGGYAYLQWHQDNGKRLIQKNEQNAVAQTQTSTKKTTKVASSTKKESADTSSASSTTADSTSETTAVDATSAQSALTQNDTTGVAWTYQSDTGNGFVFVGPTNEDGSYSKALVTDRADGQNVEIRTGTVDPENGWTVSDDVTVPW